MNRKFTREIVQEIYDEYVRVGWHKTRVAEKYGIDKRYLYRLFRKFGFPTRAVLRVTARKKITKQQVAAWAEMMQNEKLTAQELADKVGVTRNTLYRLFAWAGIPCRRSTPTTKTADGLCPEMRPLDVNAFLFCAWCPTPPPCQEWRCASCRTKMVCPCHHEELRGERWQHAYTTWLEVRRNTERAVDQARQNYAAQQLTTWIENGEEENASSSCSSDTL